MIEGHFKSYRNKKREKESIKRLWGLHLMSYNSYNAALKSYEENGPSGKEGKDVLVYSSDRTMKQRSALGATCNFKSAASVCVMDFESCK